MKLIHYLKEESPKEKKSKLIDKGLETVYKKFDVQRMTRETEKLFEEVTR